MLMDHLLNPWDNGQKAPLTTQEGSADGSYVEDENGKCGAESAPTTPSRSHGGSTIGYFSLLLLPGLCLSLGERSGGWYASERLRTSNIVENTCNGIKLKMGSDGGAWWPSRLGL